MTTGGVRPVVAYPSLAARFAAAAFSASDEFAGTTILPAMKLMIPSLLVSVSIHPGANGSARLAPGCLAVRVSWNAKSEETMNSVSHKRRRGMITGGVLVRDSTTARFERVTNPQHATSSRLRSTKVDENR